MRKLYKLLVLLFFSVISLPLWSQNFFSRANDASLAANASKRVIKPEKFRATTLNTQALRNFLSTLPAERSLGNRSQSPILQLPMPDGSTASFHVWESSIMEPALQAKFPEIRTYLGQGISDPAATVRFDYNPYYGFSAQILSPNGAVYIDPYARGEVSDYISYYKSDYRGLDLFTCQVAANIGASTEQARVEAACRGAQLYTYRLAVACTGEYARAATGLANPTQPQVHARIVTTINRVTGVYESELAIRMILVANNDLVEFTDPATDPFTQNNNGPGLLNESQSVIDGNVGFNFYDIGHTFSTGGGGIAQLGSVCGASKARGVTGRSLPIGDAYDIDYVAHEMGHQFGGNHTFNSVTSSCNGNRNTSTAYEVGSGTTIQAYAGICGSDDIQPNSDPFFHAVSFDEISNFVEAGGACKVATPTGNTLPVITSMSNNGISIPARTPFTLTATATDADGDAITYCWEEWDRGPSGTWASGATSTTAPLFKSRVPKVTGSRTFPDIAVILAGFPVNPATTMAGLKGETLPQVSRTLNFRLTVRDNRAGGGGVVSGGSGCASGGFTAPFSVNVVDAGSPFAVTSPNGGESFPGGSSQIVTWDPVNTVAAPISCANVKISLSTDGGLTYPTVLLASTPNDGSQAVTMPSVLTTTARIKVEAVGNIFFDISNANFAITAAVSGFQFDNPAATNVACASTTSTSFTLGTTALSGYSTPIVLTASDNPAGTTVTITPGTVAPGSSATVTVSGLNTLVFGTYTVKITGVSGVLTQTRDLTFNISTGTGPVIGTQPASTAACAGTNASFTVAAPGALVYQWQVSTNGGANFTSIAGAGGATLTLTGVTTALNNNQYRVLIGGQCNVTTSNAATLTVQTAPAITAQPQSATLCLGSNATFNVTANGTNLNYQWQVSTDGGNTYNNAAGASTGASYTVNGITTAMNNNRYRVVIGGTCTPALTSSAATLTVISPVAITTQPAAFTNCETGNATFTVAGNGTGVIYQWQVSTNGGTSYTNITDGTLYSGTTTATLTLNNISATLNNNLYRALLSNPTCTTPTASNGAALLVNVRPTVTLSAPQTSLLPGQSTTITATINPSAAGFNITWYKNNAIIPGVTGTTYLVDSVEVGDYKVSILNPTTGCNNESAALTIGTSASERLFIFPSPNDGQFTVSYYNSGGGSTKQTIAVYDSRGGKVYHNVFNVTGPYQLLNINIRGKAKGVYYVVVGDASGKKITEDKVLIY